MLLLPALVVGFSFLGAVSRLLKQILTALGWAKFLFRPGAD